MKDIKLKNPNEYINMPDINTDLKELPESFKDTDRVHVRYEGMVASPTHREIQGACDKFAAMPDKQKKAVHKSIRKAIAQTRKKVMNDIPLSSKERSNLADDIALMVAMENVMTGKPIELAGVN